MNVPLVTSIAAGLVMAVGIWIEARHRRRSRTSDADDQFDLNDDSLMKPEDDDDNVADIIRRARPALERAVEVPKHTEEGL